MREIESFIPELKNYTQKYELENIYKELETLEKEKDLKVSVAFLGEFSSGKSTLINALLGKKVLPAMAKPTTKNIIKIIPKNGIENLNFFLETEDGLEKIDALEFSEFTLGKKKGNTVVEVPAGEKLPEGFIFIDTPGISSLDKTDVDITFGCLPFIDGAVICQDVNFGGFTNSAIKFLKENLPQELRNKFIFAITKTDTKPESEVQQIKENSIETLRKEIGYQDAEKRVATCSPLKFLETKDTAFMEDFNKTFKEMIINKKSELVKYRKKKFLQDISDRLIDSLKHIKTNSNLDLSDINGKIEEVNRKISELQKQKETIEEKLFSFEEKLQTKYEKILMSKISSLKNVSSKQEIEEILNKISTELQRVTQRNIERFFKENLSSQEINIPELHKEIENSLQSLLSVAESVKTILRTLLAIALPGGGMADVAQGIVGYVISKAIDESETGGSSQSRGGFLRKIGGLLQTLDVPGKLVDFGTKYLIDSKLRGEFPQIARDMAAEIVEEMKEILDEDFNKIDKELKAYRDSLIKLQKEKIKKIDEFQNFISELEEDTKKVMKIREEINAT